MPNSGAPSVLVVIPARYASTRFPGKPLAPISGKPMIQHVVEHVRLATLPSRVIVATEDDRIKSAVEAFGAEAILTRPDHRTGTDRVAEVAAHIPADLYINVQGDEPLIDPGVVDALAAAMAEDETIQLVTPVRPSPSRLRSWTPTSSKLSRISTARRSIFPALPYPGFAIPATGSPPATGNTSASTAIAATRCWNFPRSRQANSNASNN